MYLSDLANKLSNIEIDIIKKLRATKWGEIKVKLKDGKVVMVSTTNDTKVGN